MPLIFRWRLMSMSFSDACVANVCRVVEINFTVEVFIIVIQCLNIHNNSYPIEEIVIFKPKILYSIIEYMSILNL